MMFNIIKIEKELHPFVRRWKIIFKVSKQTKSWAQSYKVNVVIIYITNGFQKLNLFHFIWYHNGEISHLDDNIVGVWCTPPQQHTHTHRLALGLPCNAQHPITQLFHKHKIITNPWLLPLSYNCAIFLGSLLL